MRRIFLFLFVFIFIALSYSQDSKVYPIRYGTILNYTLNPTTLRTGEKGFIRIRLADNITSSDRGAITVKNNQWFFIEDIKINHNRNEIFIWFIPLDPSVSFFPDFIIEERIYSGIPLVIESRLGNVSTLNPLGGKLLLPWTKLLFAAGFTLLVIFLFLCYYAIKVAPKKIRKTVVLKTNAFKRKYLLRKMSRLASRLSQYEKADYTKRFIQLLKEYLEIATSKKTTCFTTKEIVTAFPEAPSKELVFLDSVRFGNAAADSQVITETSEAVYSFALQLEEAAGARKI
ncbi:MAG: hypothetical protein FWC36_08655 [Spirochaetes bacterium]|nr:hypothetical protein [Spirochaetota bacterium]